MQKSRSYQEYLIESLKEPVEAAGYLWAILQEEDPEPELLLLALKDVTSALSELHMSPEQAKLHEEKLDELLEKRGSDAIYSLADLLKPLGLELTVTVREKVGNDNAIYSHSELELSPTR